MTIPIHNPANPSGPSIFVRPATESDIPFIVSIGATTFTESFAHSMPAEDLNAYLATAYNPLTFQNTFIESREFLEYFVACPIENPNEVLGYVSLKQGTTEPCLASLPAPTVELQQLYVSSKSQGMGVGKMLQEYLEKLVKERGFKTLWLGVWEENVRAQSLYQKLGFVRVGEHDFKLGTCVQTDWIMAKGI